LLNPKNDVFLRKHDYPKIAEELEKIFKDATTLTIGETFYNVMFFLVEKKLKKPPFKVLIENSACFYKALKGLLGERGLKVYMSIIADYLNSRYGLNLKAENLIHMFKQNEGIKIFLNILMCSDLNL